MLGRFFKRSKPKAVFAFARVNARLMPLDRGKRFEDPLHKALRKSRLGEVTGGGTGMDENGEFEHCGIDVDLWEDQAGSVEKAAAFVCEFLAARGAPKGSTLEYERDGRKIELPFGQFEGLAVYLNGTDLPDEVYRTCDPNTVIASMKRLLREEGSIEGHWQGPTETALYLYGPSASRMAAAIAPFMAEYPLCQRARTVQIA